MPPLNSWQTIPVPPPTLPSSTAPAPCFRQRLVDVIHRHVEAVDVVEEAVPRLARDRQRPERRPERQHPDRGPDDPVVDDADAVGVRDPDDPGQEARLADPFETRSARRCPFKSMAAGIHGLREDVAVVRNDDGHARSDGPAADDERPVATDDRRVADSNTGHIGDRVRRTRLAMPDDYPLGRTDLLARAGLRYLRFGPEADLGAPRAYDRAVIRTTSGRFAQGNAGARPASLTAAVRLSPARGRFLARDRCRRIVP